VHPLHQIGHEQIGEVIVQHDLEAAGAGRGLKGFGRQQAPNALQGFRQRLFQAERARSQLHPRADPNQEWIAQQFSEAHQGVADRRLRPPDPPGRAPDVRFGYQRVQRDEQIQIDRG
jgi:hypothetical protein